MSDTTTLPSPVVRPEESEEVKRQPPYNVILINDDDHSYGYVIRMLKQLFGYQEAKGFRLAEQVDKSGRAVVLTTTREHAELKQEQIHAFGPDPDIARCQGSMTAVIEPAAA